MRIQLRRDTLQNINANIANANMILSPGELFLETGNGIIKTTTTSSYGAANTNWDSYAIVGYKNRLTTSTSQVVGTTDTQTLTNKTFTSPAILNYSNTTYDLPSNTNLSVLNTPSLNVVTLNVGTVLANVGAGFQNIEILSTPGTGTWTLPAALRKIGSQFKVTLVGGGGAGGSGGTSSQYNSGGGSGAVVIGYYRVTNTSITSMSYGVGSGGIADPATSASQSNTIYDGITFIAGEGSIGPEGSGSAQAGGAGGTATGGTLNLNGFNGQGSVGRTSGTTNQLFSKGADTPLGFGQGGGPAGSTGGAGDNATAGTGYGSGGGGSYASKKGGNGAQGIIIIEY